MGEDNILLLRCQILAVNVHRYYIQNSVCLVHTDVDGAEQRRETAGTIQLLKENERANQHQKAVCKRHRAAEIKEDRSYADGNSGEFVDNELHQHIKNRWDFHGKGCFPSLFHGIVYLCCGIAGQIKILDLGNALHIFQHLRNQTFVSVAFPLSKGLLCPLHSSVDGEEQHQSRQCNQPHTPVKKKEHDCDDAGSQKAPRCDHDHPCGNVGHVFHGVGSDSGYLAKTVIIEPAHREITQVFRDLDPLVGTGTVARTGLEHGGSHVDNDQ